MLAANQISITTTLTPPLLHINFFGNKVVLTHLHFLPTIVLQNWLKLQFFDISTILMKVGICYLVKVF